MRIDKRIQAALDETNLPWEIEQGARHRKIRVNGKFCGILGDCAGPRTTKNTIAQIRRAARGDA